jgi:multiple antibiotic resistance protein
MADSFAVTMFGALFAVMNPFVNLPIFLGMTDGQTEAERRATALKITTYTVVMCTVVALAGSAILKFFGITTDEFRVAGGLVLAQIGFHMLNGRESTSHHGTTDEKDQNAGIEDISFYPMTFPMLVGPGTITTLIIWAHNADGPKNYIAYAAVVALVIGMLGLVMFFSGTLGKHLNAKMRVIMTRVMGMILIAIAVQMIAAGVKALLPGLG